VRGVSGLLEIGPRPSRPLARRRPAAAVSPALVETYTRPHALLLQEKVMQRRLTKTVCSLLFFAAVSARAQDQPLIQPPAGFGRYCSLKNGAFFAGDINSDPCGSASDSQIAHAGLWDSLGVNRAYVACGDGALFWVAKPEPGDATLLAAFEATKGHPNCTINVAPKRLPIFRHPWTTTSQETMTTYRGFDFALHGQQYSDAQLCRGTGTARTNYEVDVSGHVNFNPADKDSNHNAYDWLIPGNKEGDWNVRSVAAGKVVMARSRNMGSDWPKPNQNEVYVRHVVAKSLTDRYREDFVVYYAHMKSRSVSTGQVVSSGDVIGPVGTTGASYGVHLHLAVFRLRNVKGAWKDYRIFGTGGTIGLIHDITTEGRSIDPFGWNDPACIDPWAIYADAGRGAPSINLWRENLAPPGWNHAGH
jgi:Peptidase family M23